MNTKKIITGLTFSLLLGRGVADDSFNIAVKRLLT